MTPRMRRIAADWEEIKKEFTGHSNIIVTPAGEEPPEKYHITYFVTGLYILPNGKIETLGRHEVEITLHAEYPRYKPVCRILTPIWHPNFRDGQICIGDIWGAGESLSDIIINIGDMIQYKSWNSYSPLSADAAQWAIQNKHLFPVGTIELNRADYSAASEDVQIDLFDDDGNITETPAPAAQPAPSQSEAEEPPACPAEYAAEAPSALKSDENDFEITAEDLAGIEFVPSAQRMQTMSHGGIVQGKKVNFKTILVKGILWAFLGAILAFGLQESLDSVTGKDDVLRFLGYTDIANFFNQYDKLNDDSTSEEYEEVYDLLDKITLTEDDALRVIEISANISSGIFSALVALGIGLFMGIGEGVYYGSKVKAFKYALIGAGIALITGFMSGYISQLLYSSLLSDESTDFTYALIRGLSWSIVGLGIGLAVGLIKPQMKRILFCVIGGIGGGFIGGFIFNYIVNVVTFGENDTGIFSRAIGIIITGLLIGLGIGLLEQFAKQAWLKVIRGEFEGKEYLVFAGTTSIGNNGKNTIVLFKDKLVGTHHCDIVLEGNKYIIIDQGTPMGTIVNGMKINRYILRRGDTIAVGNSVLIFNTK